MNEDFQRIYDKLPTLLKDFVEIENTTSTVKEAMRAVTKKFQEEASLYFALLNIIKNGYLIRDSAFGENKEHVQDYLRHISSSDVSNSDFLVNLQKGTPLIWSKEQEDKIPYYNSVPFPLSASGILFPITRKGNIFCVIELGSEKIIHPENYIEDFSTSNAFRIPLEALSSKINQIADSKIEND